MEDEDRKALTEFLGECWHANDYYYLAKVRHCRYCEKTLPDGEINRTFDTWEDFGALWEALIEKGILGDFMKWLIKDNDCAAMAFVAWESWEPKERCIIILKAINEGVLK